jgi:hypothetical protein
MHSARSPTSIPTDYSHRKICRRITIRRHLTESFTGNATITNEFVCGRITIHRHFIESFTGNATITDDFCRRILSVGLSQRVAQMPQSSMNLRTDYSPSAFVNGLRKIWRVIKNSGAKFKIYRWIFETSPTE